MLPGQFSAAVSFKSDKPEDFLQTSVRRRAELFNHMNKREDSVDVLNERVSHETSLYFLRHFTIALEKIRQEEMGKEKILKRKSKV